DVGFHPAVRGLDHRRAERRCLFPDPAARAAHRPRPGLARAILTSMTYQPRRIRFGVALNSLRWLVLAMPLASLFGHLTPATWPLEILGLVSSLPTIWLPARPSWLLPVGLGGVATSGGALWILLPPSLALMVVIVAAFYAARFLAWWQA